jgi:hypothetical protein
MAPKDTKFSDAVMRFDAAEAAQLKLDAAQTLNLRHELEHVRAQTYDIKFPQFKARMFVPIDTSVPTGAETVAFESYEELGDAEISSDYDSEGPEVNVQKTREAQSIFAVKNKYSFSLQEIRSAAMAGNRLPARKARAARMLHEQKLDRVMLLGDSTWGLKGLYTLSNTCTYTPPAGAAGSKYWSAKTPDEILTDLFGMENTIIETTLEVERPDTLILPLSEKNRIAKLRMGDGIDGTVLQFFLANATAITKVEADPKLEAAPASEWTGKRMVAYRRAEEVLQGVAPQPFEQLPPQNRGFKTVTLCHSRLAGVEVHYPKAICYGDEIGA